MEIDREVAISYSTPLGVALALRFDACFRRSGSSTYAPNVQSGRDRA